MCHMYNLSSSTCNTRNTPTVRAKPPDGTTTLRPCNSTRPPTCTNARACVGGTSALRYDVQQHVGQGWTRHAPSTRPGGAVR